MSPSIRRTCQLCFFLHTTVQILFICLLLTVLNNLDLCYFILLLDYTRVHWCFLLCSSPMQVLESIYKSPFLIFSYYLPTTIINVVNYLCNLYLVIFHWFNEPLLIVNVYLLYMCLLYFLHAIFLPATFRVIYFIYRLFYA